MAKYNVGDKLMLQEVYMDGRFKKRPAPKVVISIDATSNRYLLANPNGTFYVPGTGDGNSQREQHWFTFQYADNSYRLATQDEIDTFFKRTN